MAYGIGKGKVVTTNPFTKVWRVYPSLLQLSDEYGFFPEKVEQWTQRKMNENQFI
jgi:hypothetical protein